MQKYFDKLYSQGIQEFYNLIDANLKSKTKTFVITANPETFTYGANDTEINKILLAKISTLIPDGIGIVKASNMLNYKVKERITGIDLATHLLEECHKNKYKLALLGAKQEVLESLINVIKKDYPNIKIVKTENGYTNNKDQFFDELVPLEPDVCLVALGIPHQEKLIFKHIHKFKKGIFVGVGGSFDVLSGTKKRAPKLFQKLNLEWLYRIIKEPKRLKRFYDNNVKFMFKIKKMASKKTNSQ